MRRFLTLALAALFLAGCDSAQRTADQVRRELAAYKEAPSDAAQEKIEAGLAKLDSEVARLEADGKSTEAKTFRSTAANLRSDYRSARVVRAMKDAQSTIVEIGDAFKQAGQSIGDAFKKESTPEP